MHGIYKLKDMLCEELEEYGKKNQIDVNDLEIIHKLAGSTEKLCKIIEAYEEEEEDAGYSRAGYRDGMRYDDRYDMRRGMSYARDGRGSDGRRTGGRSSRRGSYSMADENMKDMIGEMRELMDDMPEEKRMEMQKFINKMERM